MLKVGLNYGAIKKLLKSQAKKRPILGCMNYQKEKITFTDSYSLVDYHVVGGEEFLLDVATLKVARGTYPSTDKIKPAIHELHDVNDSFKIERVAVNRDSLEVYNIDGFYFLKQQVDDTFKTVSINFFKDITPGDLKLKKNEYNGTAYLIYETPQVYILILGIHPPKKDNEA